MAFSVSNINSIIDALNEQGITNPYLQTGILATTAKETLIKPISENLNYTSASRLRQVWPSLFTTDADAQAYTNNPEKLGNYVYGGKFGNAVNEGFKYRGRGYNGLTFKANYKRMGDLIGMDLVSNPDLVNNPNVAAKVLAVFYKDNMAKVSCRPSKYTLDGSNDINNLDSGVRVAVAITAGCPSSTGGNIFREGLRKASEFAPGLLPYVQQKKSSSKITSGKNRLAYIIVGIVIILLIVLLIIYRKKIIARLT